MAEQFVLSLQGFLLVAASGRWLDQVQFGLLSLIWFSQPMALLLVNALLGTPLNIVLPAVGEAERQATAARVMLIVRAAAVATLLLALLALVGEYLFSASGLAVTLAAGSMLVARMSYEVIRRIFILQKNEARLLRFGSLLYVVGIAAFLISLYELRSLATSLACYALSQVAIFFVVMRSAEWRRPLSMSVLVKHLRPYAKKLLPAAVLDSVAKICSPYLLAAYTSVVIVAEWGAARSLVGPSLLLLFGLINAAQPSLRGAYAVGGMSGLWREGCVWGGYVLLIYMLPLLLVFLFSVEALSLVYGPRYASAAAVLSWYCVVFALIGMNMILGALLNATGTVMHNLVGAICTLPIYVFGVPYFAGSMGAMAIPLMSIISELSIIGIRLVLLRRAFTQL